MSTPALSARDLCVCLPSGEVVVHGIDLDLHPGRLTALVGPSGAGKSLTVRALARLLPAGVTATGHVRAGDIDVLRLSTRALRRVRGPVLAWVGQDATASLNPTVTVGTHLRETLRAHPRAHTRGREREHGARALAAVGLADPERLRAAYPFELSGGQAQRVALALATVADPLVILADEVTAELDTVSQGEVMALLRGQADAGRAVLVVTHDLMAATRWADDVVVLDAGEIVEHGPPEQVLLAPTAPLTMAWAQAHARADASAQQCEHGPEKGPGAEATEREESHAEAGPVAALTCRTLGRTLYGHGRRTIALAGLDLAIGRGESVAVVGRSGSGKSTLVGVLAALDPPDTGQVLVDGTDVWAVPTQQRRAARRRVGLVFQDALSSFDPRWTVERVIGEALPPRSDRTVPDLLRQVGLDASYAARRPVTLSGGQRQRVAVARALAAEPEILLADEPTSGLDVLAQEHLIDLLARARARHGLSVVLVTHDLRTARRVADRIVVLDHGRVVSDVPTAQLHQVTHPAARELLEATGPVSEPAERMPTR